MTKKEYEKLKDSLSFRSCWNCNPAHKHLKKADYLIYCIWCEKLYYKGKHIKEIKNEIYNRNNN